MYKAAIGESYTNSFKCITEQISVNLFHNNHLICQLFEESNIKTVQILGEIVAKASYGLMSRDSDYFEFWVEAYTNELFIELCVS